MGGIGNQLFQYTFGQYLEQKLKHSVRYDCISGYKKDSYDRSYGLGKMVDVIPQVSTASIPYIFRKPSVSNSILTRIFKMVPPTLRCVLFDREDFYVEKKIAKNVAVSIYLHGYWQSFKYVSCVETRISKTVTYRGAFSPDYYIYLDKFKNNKATVVHVRDYCNDNLSLRQKSLGGEIFSRLPFEYYCAATKILSSKNRSPVYIFTDNPKYVFEMFGKKINFEIVDPRGKMSELESLWLMSQCNNIVIANSSYSWWGAWLNCSGQKSVIAPSMWGLHQPTPKKTLYPNKWQII